MKNQTRVPRTRADRIRSLILWVSVFVGTVSTTGFFIVPLLIKYWAMSALSDRLHGSASLERARVNPWALGIKLEGFKVQDTAGNQLAGFGRFDGRFELWESLFKGGLRFRRAILTRPASHAELFQSGVLNFAALLKESPAGAGNPAPARPLRKLPRIVVDDLRVIDADLSFRDATTPVPFELKVKDVNVGFGGVDLAPDHANLHRITAVTDAGERITWVGATHANPLSAKGVLTIEGFGLKRLMPYASRYTPADLTKGTLSARVSYDLRPVASPRVAQVVIEEAVVEGISLLQPDGPLVEVGKLTLKDAAADGDARSISIASVQIVDPVAHVRRDVSGQINLNRLLTHSRSTAGTPQKGRQRTDPRTIEYPLVQIAEAITNLIEDIAGEWSLAAEQLVISRGGATYDDSAAREPVHVSVSRAEITAGPIRSADRFRHQVTLDASIGDAGSAHVSGVIGPVDRTADLTIKAAGLDLATFGPYLPEQLSADLPASRLTAARLDAEGVAKASVPVGAASALAWNGAVTISGLKQQVPGGAAILQAETVEVKGSADAAGTDVNMTRASWKGSARLKAVAANIPAQTAIAAEAATVDVTGEALVDGSNARWNGSTQLTGLAGAVGGASPASLNARSLRTQGVLTLDADQHAAWEGSLDLEQWGAETKGQAAIAAGSLHLDGRAGASPQDMKWSGLIAMKDLEARTTQAPQSRVVAKGVEISGDAGVNLTDRKDPVRIEWNGRAAIDSTEASKASTGEARAQHLSLEGKAGAVIASDDRTLSWSGAIKGQSLEVKDLSEHSRGAATTGAVEIAGDTRISADGHGPRDGSWKGSIDASAINVQATPQNPASIQVASAQVSGDARAEDLGAAEPDLHFSGDARTGVIDVASPDRMALKATLSSFAAQGVDIATRQPRLAAAAVSIDRPVLEASTALLPPPGQKSAPRRFSGAQLRELIPIQFSIGSAKITDGRYIVTDTTANPPARLRGEDLNITATNLSGDGQRVADVRVSARLQETGRLSVGGSVDLFRDDPFADVQIEIDSLPLKPYELFTGRYVGYLVDQGRLSMKLPVKAEGGRLKGDLNFNLDKFYLGQEVDSPDAPDLPVQLGLSLLRDVNEQIKGDIPISGDMNEPDFSLIGVVWKAFFNLITKAATAPFQVLGSLLGAGEGEDLSYIAFEPGRATLPPDSLAKLDKLAKGLTDRPGLSLAVVGRVNDGADAGAIRLDQLKAQMRHANGDRALTPEEYTARIEDMYYASIGSAKPARKRGEPPPVAVADMEARVLESVPVPPETLTELARARAAAVVGVLVKDNAIPDQRVKAVLDADIHGRDPRADLQLK